MAISSGLPTSRRGYLSQAELAQFANITISDTDEADDVISQAEEMVDAFVGYHRPFMEHTVEGLAQTGTSTTVTLDSEHSTSYQTNYFTGCEIEILGGTGAGQRRRISSNTSAGVVTVANSFDTTPDDTSFYRIYQIGKFPRIEDVASKTASGVSTYYKSIPEAIKRATAAQVEYIIGMGSQFFKTDKSNYTSESIGDYSYSMGTGIQSAGIGVSRLVSPKAKLLLRGYINRTGRIVE